VIREGIEEIEGKDEGEATRGSQTDLLHAIKEEMTTGIDTRTVTSIAEETEVVMENEPKDMVEGEMTDKEVGMIGEVEMIGSMETETMTVGIESMEMIVGRMIETQEMKKEKEMITIMRRKGKQMTGGLGQEHQKGIGANHHPEEDSHLKKDEQ
jgi:hypothetical protein